VKVRGQLAVVYAGGFLRKVAGVESIPKYHRARVRRQVLYEVRQSGKGLCRVSGLKSNAVLGRQLYCYPGSRSYGAIAVAGSSNRSMGVGASSRLIRAIEPSPGRCPVSGIFLLLMLSTI